MRRYHCRPPVSPGRLRGTQTGPRAPTRLWPRSLKSVRFLALLVFSESGEPPPAPGERAWRASGDPSRGRPAATGRLHSGYQTRIIWNWALVLLTSGVDCRGRPCHDFTRLPSDSKRSTSGRCPGGARSLARRSPISCARSSTHCANASCPTVRVDSNTTSCMIADSSADGWLAQDHGWPPRGDRPDHGGLRPHSFRSESRYALSAPC